MQALQWAIPSGGVGAAIAWVANRKVRQAEQAKKVHDTYKEMYEDVSTLLDKNKKKYDEITDALDKLTNENDKTRRALNRLRRAIEAIQVCPHRATCPISNELSLDEDNDTDPQPGDSDRKRKPRQQRKPRHSAEADDGADRGEPARDVVADVAGNTAGQ